MLFCDIIFIMEKKFIKIYTDGACQGNPGKGGWGAILMYKDKNNVVHKKELSKGYVLTTNNRMELSAVIEALNSLKEPCKIVLYSDSKYVTEAINKNWLKGWQEKNWKLNTNNPVKNIDLWKKFLIAQQAHDIEFVWVKGHNENEYNELCDKLAVRARTCENLEHDKEFELTALS